MPRGVMEGVARDLGVAITRIGWGEGVGEEGARGGGRGRPRRRAVVLLSRGEGAVKCEAGIRRAWKEVVLVVVETDSVRTRRAMGDISVSSSSSPSSSSSMVPSASYPWCGVPSSRIASSSCCTRSSARSTLGDSCWSWTSAVPGCASFERGLTEGVGMLSDSCKDGNSASMDMVAAETEGETCSRSSGYRDANLQSRTVSQHGHQQPQPQVKLLTSPASPPSYQPAP